MRLLLILCCLASIKSYGQNCLPDGITFTSQNQIDSFPINHPSCTQILGLVTIKEALSSNITNTDSLIQLTELDDGLIIQNNAGLNDLIGLNNLMTINYSSPHY